MLPRSISVAGNVCLRCQWRLLNRRPGYRLPQNSKQVVALRHVPALRRLLQTSAEQSQTENLSTGITSPPTFDPGLIPRPPGVPLRQHLEKWQEQYGGPPSEALFAFQNHPLYDEVVNGSPRLSVPQAKEDETVELHDFTHESVGEAEDLVTVGLFLKPGDVVEVNLSGQEPVLAVFVQQLDRISQFFSVTGRWTHSELTRVRFVIQGAIDPSLLQPIFPFLPTDPTLAAREAPLQVPTEVAKPLIEQLESIMKEAETMYRKHAAVLDTAYEKLADTQSARMMSLTQIAKHLLAPNDPEWTATPAVMLAIRKALNQNMYRFRSDHRSQRLTNSFSIRPKQEVANIETVHQWVREYRESHAASANRPKDGAKEIAHSKGSAYVSSFLKTARELVNKSRKHREPNLGTLGPSMARCSSKDHDSGIELKWGTAFSSTDKMIIAFFQAWVIGSQFAGMPALHAACATLLQAMDCYGNDIYKNMGTYHIDAPKRDISISAGLLFLQEIGVLSPFENRYLYDEQLLLPGIRPSRNLKILQARVESLREKPGFHDSMSDLRKDWGATTVYCIDDAGAQEIDDGISVERLDGPNAGFWIHVHVANPTAFFDKRHTLSALAAHMTETLYTPERSYPMLPTWVSQGHFSLDRDRPVITFSTRIDTQGNVVDTKIQNGIIRKVVSLTPQELSQLLGDQEPNTETIKLVVGGELPLKSTTRTTPTISAEELSDLHDLYAATSAVYTQRSAHGGIRFTRPSTHVRIYGDANRSRLEWTPPSLEKSRSIIGDPIIELTTNTARKATNGTYFSFDFSAKYIVEEAMMLAGTTAASWCSKRGIPVIFRGTIQARPPEGGLSHEQIKEQSLSYLKQYGWLTIDLTHRYVQSLGRAIAHTSQLPHEILGVAGYVKVTSPLRRFSDMMAHWQIEAALRHEARTGQILDEVEPNRDTVTGVLPFSRSQMQDSIITLTPREMLIRKTEKYSIRYWSLMALFRATLYERQSLPESFWRLSVQHTDAASVIRYNGVIGNLAHFGLRACMMTKDWDNVKVGDEWEVELDSFDLFLGDIYVKPVRLISREPELI